MLQRTTGALDKKDTSMCDKLDNTIGSATIYTCTRPVMRSQGVRHVVYQISTGQTLNSEEAGGVARISVTWSHFSGFVVCVFIFLLPKHVSDGVLDSICRSIV